MGLRLGFIERELGVGLHSKTGEEGVWQKGRGTPLVAFYSYNLLVCNRRIFGIEVANAVECGVFGPM